MLAKLKKKSLYITRAIKNNFACHVNFITLGCILIFVRALQHIKHLPAKSFIYLSDQSNQHIDKVTRMFIFKRGKDEVENLTSKPRTLNVEVNNISLFLFACSNKDRNGITCKIFSVFHVAFLKSRLTYWKFYSSFTRPIFYLLMSRKKTMSTGKAISRFERIKLWEGFWRHKDLVSGSKTASNYGHLQGEPASSLEGSA